MLSELIASDNIFLTSLVDTSSPLSVESDSEKKYFNGERYTVFVLYEINKKEMFKYMKKQAKTQKYVDKKTEKLIEDLIDQELSKIDNE